ncbi:MAG: glycosyltransferase family 39 protein [archaeon]
MTKAFNNPLKKSVADAVSCISDNPLLIHMALIAFHSCLNYWVITENKLPMFGDDAAQAVTAIRMAEDIRNGQAMQILNYGISQPMLHVLLGSWVVILFGASDKALILLNIPFMAILVFSIFGIGRMLHSKGAGVLAAIVVMSFPHVFGLSRVFFYDYPFMCSVTLAIYAMLKTDSYRSRKWCIMFGLALALAADLKTTASVYLAGPIIWHAFIAVKKGEMRPKIANAAMTALGFVIGTAPFYLPAIGSLSRHALEAVTVDMTPQQNMGPVGLFLFGIRYYVGNLAGYQILHFYFIILAAGACFLAIRRRWLLLCWMLIPIVFFSLVSNNLDVRFTLPILPAAALIISIFAYEPRPHHRPIIAVIAAVGLLQTVYVSAATNHDALGMMNRELMLSGMTVQMFQHEQYGPNPFDMHMRGLAYPVQYTWNTDDIMEILESYHDPLKHEKVLAYSTPLGFALDYLLVSGDSGMSILCTDCGTSRDLIRQADYVLRSDIDQMQDKEVHQDVLRNNPGYQNFSPEGFSAVGAVPYPGVTLYIYKRIY